MASELAALTFFVIGIWDKAHNGSVSAFVLVCLSVPLFWMGAVITYIKKVNEVESLKKERNLPELYIQYEDSFRNDFMNSGFFLRVEGERKASNVEISSEQTIGDGHVRLQMTWGNPGHPIGKTAVPVKAECVYQKDGANHLYHNRMGDQIYTFFDRKRDNPRELIVTLNYTDLSGRVCPARKFRVCQNAPYVTDGKVSCEPIKAQIAS